MAAWRTAGVQIGQKHGYVLVDAGSGGIAVRQAGANFDLLPNNLLRPARKIISGIMMYIHYTHIHKHEILNMIGIQVR
jgi:hypothetical protein